MDVFASGLCGQRRKCYLHGMEVTIIKYLVLGIGYPPEAREAEQAEWLSYGVRLDFAETLQHAIEKIQQVRYICIAVQSDKNISEIIRALHEVCTIPTVILPPTYTAAERYVCAHLGAIQYVRATGQSKVAEAGSEDSMRYYLDIPTGERKPLTIITVKDLSFCLEHRSVEVRHREIELTAKEFDILALLIMNQRRVFTYDMIMEAVWREDISFYSPKAITTHISNLRRKLKTAPDVPEYIQSVRGVGYKFAAIL